MTVYSAEEQAVLDSVEKAAAAQGLSVAETSRHLAVAKSMFPSRRLTAEDLRQLNLHAEDEKS